LHGRLLTGPARVGVDRIDWKTDPFRRHTADRLREHAATAPLANPLRLPRDPDRLDLGVDIAARATPSICNRSSSRPIGRPKNSRPMPGSWMTRLRTTPFLSIRGDAVAESRRIRALIHAVGRDGMVPRR
jgi:hypothetical protein